MRIGLIQIDGKLPNLALMKLSTWHKQRGDQIYLMRDKTIASRLVDFDKIYISCIFDENKQVAFQVQKQFKNAVIGGIGVNDERLIPFVEHIMPDYETFDCDYSLGFTTRGCIRNCEFCKVPHHEGRITVNCDIYEFWDKKHKHIVLLDNNILAIPKHFKKISEQLMKEGLSVDFNQGLDIRLVNDMNAKILSELKVRPHYRFAFDRMDMESNVVKGIEVLKSYGIKQSLFYVLVGFDTTLDQDLHRLNLLKEHGQRAYVMRHKSCKGNRTYSYLAAWANQQRFFGSMGWNKFKKYRFNRGLKLIKN